MGNLIKDKTQVDEPQDLRATVALQAEQIRSLKHYILQLQKMIFGPRSEKLRSVDALGSTTGLLPFPEFAELEKKVTEDLTDSSTLEVKGYKRPKNGRRKDFPAHLPRFRTDFKLTGDDLICDCGECMVEIGELVTQLLERIEHSWVHEIARKKYACPKCQDAVHIAEGPHQIFDKCMLGPSFLAQVIYDRFGNHMPYARLEKKYLHEGLSLSRSVLCTSALRCAELLEPIYQAIVDDVLQAYVVQSDDTEIAMRDGPKGGRSKVNLWAYRDQDGGVFYSITNARNRDGPRSFLHDRNGIVQSDGHKCFDDIGDNIVRVGCWAHMRRKFVAAKDSGEELAIEALRHYIKPIFAIEAQAKRDGLDKEALLKNRQGLSKPLVEKFKDWLELQKFQTTGLPKGSFMDAVQYALNQWKTLTRFLEDGGIKEITNNACERALRAPVVGRRNWMFFGSQEGGRKGAILMTLVNSCKEFGVNPLEYLRDVLHQVSYTPASKVSHLTPKQWQIERAAKARESSTAEAIATVVASYSVRD